MNLVLKRPIITEKSMKLADQGQFTFEVDQDATKERIADAVAKKFNVKVINVKTVSIKGQVKMQKRVRRFYHTDGIKKALVTLAKGQKIPLFEKATELEPEVTRAEEPEVLKEKKSLLRDTKVKIERGAIDRPTTQRKVITGEK